MSLKKLLMTTILLVSLFAQFTLTAATLDIATQQKLAQATNYLSLADRSPIPQAYHYELLAAELYIQAGAFHKAEALIASLSQTPLPRQLNQMREKIEHTLLERNKMVIPAPVAVESRLNAQSHIALFLPLTGAYAGPAQAIKEGFLAQHDARSMPVRIYDTSQTSDICNLYYQAVQNGAHFVVGPLIKENVYTLSKVTQLNLTVPVLALNTHPDIQITGSKPFFLFALSPEDEAKSLANKAFANGHRRASLIVPDNDWGNRVLNAFSTQWKSLDGKLVSTALIQAKQDPAISIRKLLNIHAQYDPKKTPKDKIHLIRRQDIDMIVLAAPPEQARQWRPLLDFYEAQDLKVYSTSSVYEGKLQPQQDRDLNGIIFCDMPFMLNNPNESQNSLSRLRAMGLDAYQLMSRLPILLQTPGAQYHGATGLLSMGPNHKIERELTWAQIRNGVPNLL
jgi:outer membrane PBP1 activator LpoA protein